MHTLDPAILAATDWSTGVMLVIGNILKLVAVFVVLGAAFKAIKDFTGGKPGAGAKTIIFSVIIVAFLWNPSLIDRIINIGAGFADKGLTTIENTTDGGGVVGDGQTKG